MPNASYYIWGNPKTALATLQKIAVGFWMPKFGGNLESSPLVIKRLLASFHVHTNQLFDKCKNITAAEFLFTISKGVKSAVCQGEGDLTKI